MSTQVTATIQFFTNPNKSRLGHLVKQHGRVILMGDKLVSIFHPGAHRAHKLQTALWRKQVREHHQAVYEYLRQWEDSLQQRERKLHGKSSGM